MNTVDVGSLSFTYCSTGCTFHYSSQCCAWLIPFHPSCCRQTYFHCSCLVFNVYLEHGSIRSYCASLLLKKVNHDAVNVKCYWPLLSTHACWAIMKAPHCCSAACSSCGSHIMFYVCLLFAETVHHSFADLALTSSESSIAISSLCDFEKCHCSMTVYTPCLKKRPTFDLL